MKKNNSLMQKKHYDEFAVRKKIRDFYEPSKICRKAIVKKALERVKIKNKVNILEIGCGIAATAIYLDGYYKNYIGIDISKEMIEIGREINRNNKKVKLIVGDAFNLKIKKGFPDIIFFDGVLHHIDDVRGLLKKLKLISHKNTVFLAREPHNGNFIFQLLRKIRMLVDKSYSSDQIFFSKKEIETIFKDAGFKKINFEYQDYLIPIIAQVPMKPEFIFLIIAKYLIKIEKFLERFLPNYLKKLTWNFSINAKF
tara:strand:+ start:339 stop:1100 length:762 start_codon:yes stop_codon:yes gene_type:complete